MSQFTNAKGLTSPALQVVDGQCVLSGDWVIAAVNRKQQVKTVEKYIAKNLNQIQLWDLSAVRIDHIWAGILWRAWGKRLPSNTRLNQEQQAIFSRLEKYSPLPQDVAEQKVSNGFVIGVGEVVFSCYEHTAIFTQMIGQFFLDIYKACKIPSRVPWADFFGQLLRMGAFALPITGLVGFLIGVVIVYLLGGFLSSYGLEYYVVNLTGIVSIRELGGLLAAILVAGRSGSTITAQIGVMRQREEIDAMHVLGISPQFRLVFPRVMALSLIMPFVSLWTSLVAVLGGMLAANLTIGLSNEYFLSVLPSTVYIGNIWMNLGKGVVFGFLIAMIGCHFGLLVKSDTQSLGNGTTASVVASITSVILVDAIFAILCKNVPVAP